MRLGIDTRLPLTHFLLVKENHVAKYKDKRLESILLRELTMAKGELQELVNNWSQ